MHLLGQKRRKRKKHPNNINCFNGCLKARKSRSNLGKAPNTSSATSSRVRKEATKFVNGNTAAGSKMDAAGATAAKLTSTQKLSTTKIRSRMLMALRGTYIMIPLILYVVSTAKKFLRKTSSWATGNAAKS